MEKDSEIFHKLADKYQFSIEDTHRAEEFFNELMELTGGSVNTDFIDGNNFDHIEKVEFNHDDGLLTLYFYRPEKDPISREMRKMAMPFDYYTMTIRFDFIRFIRSDERDHCIAFAIHGSTDNKRIIKKTIRKELTEQNYKGFKENFFATTHFKIENKESYNVVGIDTPIVSCWVIPKDFNISPTDSKYYLYKYNLLNLKERLKRIGNTVDDPAFPNKPKEIRLEILQSAGNGLRNIAESLLKLQTNYYPEPSTLKSEEYHSLKFGDMTRELCRSGIITKEDKKGYDNFITTVNDLSHASGIPVALADVNTKRSKLEDFIKAFSDVVKAGRIKKFERVSSLPSPSSFIQDAFQNWNFKEEIDSIVKTPDGKCVFRIKKDSVFTDITKDLEYLFGEKGIFLCKDGYFRDMEANDDRCLTVYSREEFVALIQAIYSNIEEKCRVNGYDPDGVELHVNITDDLKKNGTPSHLFTLEEITQLMQNADDSEYNQLVIDEDGYPRLNNTPGYGSLYPVSQEGWNAGNGYVGKYSTLSDAEPSYHLCLKGWLSYLKTGNRFYDDYYSYIPNVKEIISEIEALTAQN